ncbi:MAG: 2-succinyl-5-enolpyruvyl-6-hydroxy-3-cyclohexene-1-carboxylic-acid synthase [Chloroflexi bacterium]|nr:2-succinyl-5-enolpyruvyl-6-hydroxy-3-cyclohexene-1-carboxylic-acid synthase [Chloroflexota bacterium]
MRPENRNYAFAGALVDELARSGLRHVCICPGSRSSPLAISFARHEDVKTWIHLDERSAGFFALGMAKGLGEPVAVVCTSGTAAANLLPAIVEARQSFTPLLALTSDRPPELVEWGANQTIVQSRMYGVHAKWAVDLPLPEATPDLLRYVRALGCRAYATAAGGVPGPVHINLPFREPLAPEQAPEDFSTSSDEEAPHILAGHPDGRPFTSIPRSSNPAGRDLGERLSAELSGEERGIIVCGPQRAQGFPHEVTKAARALGYPVLADPLSQVRCGTHGLESVIENYDLFLRDTELTDRLRPEVVLRFGATPTSRALGQYLETCRASRHILVRDGGWHDPSHLATDVLEADPTEFCVGLTSEVGKGPGGTGWLERWLSLRDSAREAVKESLGGMDELFEGKVFSQLWGLLPEGSILFAGNSMPVRDMDGFLPVGDKSVRCMANRGASGIDGVVSTALGVGAGTGDPLVLVLGDLSLYHDMNGLLAANRYDINATIIVVNNDGGGIFSFLPQAGYSDLFEEIFGTPHGLKFGPAAEMYGLEYSRVTSWGEFEETVSRGLASPSTAIIEIPGDRARNVELHQQVWTRVAEAVRAAEKR